LAFIKKLHIVNYRVYKDRYFDFLPINNIIYGKNGVGKTNVLESISMLSVGKGLLNADMGDILRVDEKSVNSFYDGYGWSVNANIIGHPIIDDVMVYTENDKKKIKMNGNVVRGQNELNDIFNIIWLTPNMQNFFNEDKSVRRKFLDRCVYLINTGHAKLVSKYEYYVKERIKVLQEKYDVNWLSVLENKIAETGVEITMARENVVNIMNNLIEKYDFEFPKFILSMEKGIFKNSDEFRQLLFKNRQQDKFSKRTKDGTHKSDLKVFYHTKNIMGEFCSTGEQKLLLISLTLLKAFMCVEMKKASPIILLDEVFSYLDNTKKIALFSELKKLQVQTFITATDIKVFDGMLEGENCIAL
jgi:DNA replication and repair protein RecF